MPPGVGPTALRLIEDTMAKGLVLALIRRGGWRLTESLRDGQPVRGRLWQRHPPPDWHLTPFAMHLCRWLVAERMRPGECDALDRAPSTIADHLVLYLALDLTARARCASALAGQRAARESALCWLGFADVLTEQTPRVGPPDDISVYRFTRWMSGTGAVVLEALQPDLAARWVAAERAKRLLGRPQSLIAIGRNQGAVLEACFLAAESGGRRDLCGFAIAATRALLAERPDSGAWEPALERGGSLQLRSEARRAHVTLLAAAAQLRRWAEEARAVRFFDDDYEAAQLYLRLWESLGDPAYQRAEAIVQTAAAIDGLIADPDGA